MPLISRNHLRPRNALGALGILALTVMSMGCQPAATPDPPAAQTRMTLTGDWTLRELNGQPAPLGAGARPATLQFQTDSMRVVGFAGCNRYFGGYTLDGTSLRFSGIGMTRMACSEGMALEQQLAGALEATRRYQLDGNQLTLLGETGPVARFDRVP